MFELKRHEDYRDLPSNSYFAVYDLTVFETSDEWKRLFENLEYEFRERMGSEKRFFEVGSMQPFQSPIDGEMITNTKSLGEHNRRHNVTQVGDEFKNKREEYLEKVADQGRDDALYNKATDAEISNIMKELQT